MGPDGTVNVGWDNVLANLQNQAMPKMDGTVRHEPIILTIGQVQATI